MPLLSISLIKNLGTKWFDIIPSHVRLTGRGGISEESEPELPPLCWVPDS